MKDIKLDERSKRDFLVYANSVIKSRAIPSVEDSLKPIHRKILYTLYEDKIFPDKPTKKCATECGRVLAYSPHGEASIYGAMIRLAQWWKLRYPLIEVQGNCGNILGDSPAAMRYTESRLSPIGMLMLQDLDNNAVDFKPNYDGTTNEPVVLPSRFPFLLCGNSSGIAVGLSSDLVSHNYHEVAEGIKYYIDHPDCSIADLMHFIKGPDFPTGGRIINGEDLLSIYSTGRGAVKVQPHYDVVRTNKDIQLIFHDLPYGVDIDSGVKAPLKKMVLEDSHEEFLNLDVKKVGARNFDIIITIDKTANVAQCLNLLFTKTRLADSIKINQTVIIDGEPRLLTLKQMIEYWVSYRSSIIQRIANNNYDKTNHKLTVTIGLQKCMSDIDNLISLIRNADNQYIAKSAIMDKFALNDEQAEAVLNMKLSKLSKLDLQELNDTEHELEETIAKLKNIIDNDDVRLNMIKQDLDDMKEVIGEDKRLTEIVSSQPDEVNMTEVKKEWFISSTGLNSIVGDAPDTDLVDVVVAYNEESIYGYNAAGEMAPITNTSIAPFVGAFVISPKDTKLVSVSKKGNIKVSLLSDYKLTKSERAAKVKDDDEIVMVSSCNDNDFVILFNGSNVLKLAVKDLAIANKTTLGVKSGFDDIVNASVARDADVLLCVTNANKGKFTPVSDFSTNSRGNKGQAVPESTVFIRTFAEGRNSFYVQSTTGRHMIEITKDKITTKGRSAIGASISKRQLVKIV